MIGSAVTTILYWTAFVGLVGWEGSRGWRERRRRRRVRERDERAREAQRERWRRGCVEPVRCERVETLPSGRTIRVVTSRPLAPVPVAPPPRAFVEYERLEALYALPAAPDREPWPDPAVFRADRAAIRRLPMCEEPGDEFR